jgi:hypothetical protein
MIIDCGRCEVRGLACGSCAAPAITTAAHASADVVATAIVSQVREPGRPGGPAPDLGPAELRALRVLASAGLIAPLRYAPRVARAS